MRPWRAALLLLLLPAAARAHGALPVSKQILFDGDKLMVPTRGWGLFVGSDGGPWRWICDEAINRDLDRVWARSGDGTLHTTDYAGLTSSRDGGCTWVQATGEIAARATSAVAADPIDPRGAWATSYGGAAAPWEALFFTADDGLTWTPVYTVDEDLRGVALSADGATLYLVGIPRHTDGGAAGPVLHVSRDRGKSFTSAPLVYALDGQSALDAVPIAVDPADPSTAYLSAYVQPQRALLKVSGFGAQVSEAFYLGADVGNVAFDSAHHIVYAATWTGLRRSVGGGPFDPVGNLHLVPCVEPHGGRLYACSWNFAPDNSALSRSDDGGAHFARLFQYGDTAGPIDTCPAGTPVATICPNAWALYACQLGINCGASAGDAAVDNPGTGGGGCGCGGHGGGGTSLMQAALLAIAIVLRLGLRHR